MSRLPRLGSRIKPLRVFVSITMDASVGNSEVLDRKISQTDLLTFLTLQFKTVYSF